MRILIVDDDESMGKMLQKGLEKMGYAADYLSDPELAERRLSVSHMDYDAVILDLMMPKRTGFEVAKSLRSQKIGIPILVLSGKYDINDKVAALDSGADDYMVKPFSLDEVVARIRALLRRPKEVIPEVMHTRNITLDPATRTVTVNNKAIELTVKEFSLLEYLMRHPGQVVNRNQILDHLWGFDFDSFSNVVDVHIKNLRRKLGGAKSPIETIRGVGYRIKS